MDEMNKFEILWLWRQMEEQDFLRVAVLLWLDLLVLLVE